MTEFQTDDKLAARLRAVAGRLADRPELSAELHAVADVLHPEPEPAPTKPTQERLSC